MTRETDEKEEKFFTEMLHTARRLGPISIEVLSTLLDKHSLNLKDIVGVLCLTLAQLRVTHDIDNEIFDTQIHVFWALLKAADQLALDRDLGSLSIDAIKGNLGNN